MVQRDLQETESDVLILMDTCGRFGMPPSSRSKWQPGQGKTELMASFEWENFDLTSVSTGFTQLIINELTARYHQSQVFSAADLHCGIISVYNFHRESRLDTQVVPLFMKLGGAAQDCGILLRPLAWPSQVLVNSGEKIVVEASHVVKKFEGKTITESGHAVREPKQKTVAGPSRAFQDLAQLTDLNRATESSSRRMDFPQFPVPGPRRAIMDSSQRTITGPSKPSNGR